jgi:hypothetical protein
MGEIINMPIIYLENYCIKFWKCKIDIENYRIEILPFSPVEERNSKNIESMQFDTNYQWYLFERSQNYIVTCFSSRFVLDFCTQNDIKQIILYSKLYKNESFWIKPVQNQDSGWKLRWNWYFVNKQSQNDNLKLWPFTYVIQTYL